MKRLLIMLTWEGVYKNLICVKSEICFAFSDKMSIFLIYLYISSILYH